MKGDIFAGVEAGGILSAETFWFPPIAKSTEKSVQGGNQQQNEEIASYDPKNKLKLAAISGKASVVAGAGASGEFGVKIQGGVFIFTAHAKAVFGIGCSGSVDLELNGESLNEFVDCLLGVLKKSEFRRLSAFGEVDANGINQDFEHLNDLLTIATALGLTFAKAILLPFDVWQDYKKQALSKEYAPFLASKINTEDPKLKRNMQRWMVKMPPETLANLLNVLCQKQSGSLLNYRDDVIDAKTDNLNQANAILKIMEWLANDSAETDDTNQRQWKETLISMAGVNKAEKSKLKDWQGYQDSWFKLAEFIEEVSSTQQSRLETDMKKYYSDFSTELGANMVLIKEESMASVGYTASIGSAITTPRVAYRVYPYSVVKDHDNGLENYEYVKLDSDSKVTRTRINWSFSDVEL
ncbi:hypothetical protein [Vibrio ponticus]|uniref:hypothetical protein n=1 Tax=Vibrio ponticus TaxID=265668 RepID=UPI000F4EE664|nr:hypothetical protein [Vibrio ponticus]